MPFFGGKPARSIDDQALSRGDIRYFSANALLGAGDSLGGLFTLVAMHGVPLFPREKYCSGQSLSGGNIPPPLRTVDFFCGLLAILRDAALSKMAQQPLGQGFTSPFA